MVALPSDSLTVKMGAVNSKTPVLSMMVSTVLFVELSTAPPVGLLNVTITVSSGSIRLSGMIGMLMPFNVSPGPNASVPDCAI